MNTSRTHKKIALVTGASGGVGSAVFRRLALEGMAVVGTYVHELGDVASNQLDELAAAGHEVEMVCLDQRNPKAIDNLANMLEKKYARLDVLINNAAWNTGVPFANLKDLTPDLWDRVLETNLRGPFLLARACMELLQLNGGGHVINISSVAGKIPIGSSIAYASGKAGLNHLTKCLAVAMAPEVAVNCIALGLVENTRMANRSMDKDSQQKLREKVLLKRNVQLEDVSNQIMVFLASTSITGQIITIDGGLV